MSIMEQLSTPENIANLLIHAAIIFTSVTGMFYLAMHSVGLIKLDIAKEETK